MKSRNIAYTINIALAIVIAGISGFVISREFPRQATTAEQQQPTNGNAAQVSDVQSVDTRPVPTPIVYSAIAEFMNPLVKLANRRDTYTESYECYQHDAAILFVPMIKMKERYNIDVDYDLAKSLFLFDVEAKAKDMLATGKYANPHRPSKADNAGSSAAEVAAQPYGRDRN